MMRPPRAGLWPKAEADVIGVSPAPANSLFVEVDTVRHIVIET